MAGGAETPNIAALPAIPQLGACESARGPDADRHVKLLIQFVVEGSLSGAYSQHWQANGLKPHIVRGFKVSRDPKFVEKLEDIVGLYMSPPEHALVLCCDEKSQVQALDRT